MKWKRAKAHPLRRRTDRLLIRLGLLLVILTIALGVMATYTSYRAIRMMDSIEEMQHNVFRAGFMIGRAKAAPEVGDTQ